MPKFIDITGKHFGRLTVLERVVHPHRADSFWRCRCECGNEAIVSGYKMRIGHTQSCGCLWLPSITAAKIKHGQTGTPAWRSFMKARQRCCDPNNNRYALYGGRGIEFRFADFNAFFAELGERPRGTSLDRKDPNGHYEPGNVRWATSMEQRHNRRRHRHP